MLLLLLFQISSSFCRENEIFKNKSKKQQKVDQFLSYKKANLGPLFNSTAYIYMYLSVELKAGPGFGVSSVKNWSKSSVKNWSKFFFSLLFPHFWARWKTQIVSHCPKMQNLGDVKNEAFKKKIAFLFFFFTETEKGKTTKWKRPKIGKNR